MSNRVIFTFNKKFCDLFLLALRATFSQLAMFIISFSFGYIINLLDLLALRLFIIHFGFIFDSFGSTSTSFYSFLSF